MDTVAPAIYCRECRYSLHGLDRHRCPECGRAFDPQDPTTVAVPDALADVIRRTEQRVFAALRVVRPLSVPVVALWVAWATLAIRTTGPGAGADFAGTTLAAITFGMLPSLLAWLGARKRYWAGVLLTILVPALLAEGVATLEEQLFVAECRKLPATAPVVFTSRWWPNGDHDLCYDPATGTLGGGD